MNEKIQLINIDCMEYMATLADNAFNLAIVDPPYGVGTACIKNNSTRTKLAIAKNYKSYANNRNNRPLPEYFKELKRVSKNQIVWGANHLCGLFDAAGPGWIVWDKEATGYYADCELAYSSFGCSLKRYRYPWNGMIQGFHGRKRDNEVRIHPSQKPVALYKWLLTNYAKPGQRILDTHLGSASSAIAAHYFGCEFVGCEIDPDYYQAAAERFDRETRQLDLLEES